MDKLILQKDQSDKLIFYGVLLFLLGLITGLFIPALANPRMGLSSHLEGVINGIFLIVLGLIWTRVALSSGWLKVTFWLALYGTFANWLGVLVAAVFNAGKMMGIAAEGKEGHPLAEAFVNFCLISLTVAMLVICITVLTGLGRKMKQNRESGSKTA